MSEIYFVSDTHFNHTNIIKYCNRPFSNVADMDEALIDNWNSRIKPNDIVYHLGDFMFGKDNSKFDHEIAEFIFKNLNGIKYLIKGNHESFTLRNYSSEFRGIYDYFKLKDNNDEFILFHYPIAEWDKCHRGSIHCFGHVHNGRKPEGKSLDVGVDANNYYPIHIDEVRQKVKNISCIAHH